MQNATAAAPSYSEKSTAFISEYWPFWLEHALIWFWSWKEKPQINQSGQKLEVTKLLCIRKQRNSGSYLRVGRYSREKEKLETGRREQPGRLGQGVEGSKVQRKMYMKTIKTTPVATSSWKIFCSTQSPI